jgi:hypothetical protein
MQKYIYDQLIQKGWKKRKEKWFIMRIVNIEN